jgi:hypothetical protein
MNLFTRKAASVAAFTVLGLTAGGVAWAHSDSVQGAGPAAPAGSTATAAGTDDAMAGAMNDAMAGGGPAARLRGLGRHVLHGEVVIQTKKGIVTAVIARGTVSAIDGNSISVKSADGVTTTFTVNDKTKVRSAGATISISAVHVGDKVGVLGVKSGYANAPVARTIRKAPAGATSNG